MSYEDAARLRERQEAADDEAARAQSLAEEGSACFVGKTVSAGSYPSTAGKVYAITPQVVLGTETEGSTASFTGVAGTIYATHIGATAPPVATTVVVRRVNHRFTFRY